MKKLIIALMLVSGTMVAQAQTAPAPNPNAAKFQFTGGETHDFGTLPEGPAAIYEFQFKNTGKEPLIIQNASASCGCTTPTWSKDPVLPGKTGKITVQYNTQGRPGPFTKTIFIQSNAPAQGGKDRYEIYIKGTVTPAAGAPAGGPAKQ
jgi:hypothetical protein